MAAIRILPVLRDVREQIDALEIALAQLDATPLPGGAAEAADLASAHTVALDIAAKLAKAASEALSLCRRIDGAQRDHFFSLPQEKHLDN
ncbi:MAG: hypothetical protein WCD20_11600 [Rhodomicrobium sp.]